MIPTTSDGKGACALVLYAGEGEGREQVAMVGFNDCSVFVLGSTKWLRDIHGKTIRELLRG